MTRTGHFPEPRPPYGGLAAEGALNLLGRPSLDPLVVLMREAAQNSWDARAPARASVGFRVELRLFDETEKAALRKVFTGFPPRSDHTGDSAERELRDVLESPELRALVITDIGTRGLGGPLRADQPAQPGESTDLVDLVFNIGQPPDKPGGGTYGFGKTISYLVSTCRTVLIHTVTVHRGATQHRVIGQAIGRQYTHEGKNYTGRHWWGTVGEHRVEPVTGDPASSIARELDLPEIEAHGGGTTLVILDPDLGARSPHQAATFMANALAWNFWPKMVAEPGDEPAMQFAVWCDGQRIQVPDPEQVPPLAAFAQALHVVRSCESGRSVPADHPAFHVFPIASERPKANLGWLALHVVTKDERPPLDEGPSADVGESTASSFGGASHHVALMRQPELVVTYLEGLDLPHADLEWAGVFKAAAEVDAEFAQAEPPTHDAWNPESARDAGRRTSFVRVALKRIKERSKAFTAPPPTESAAASPSAVTIADALADLLPSGPGTGASTEPSRSDAATRSPRRTARVSVLRRWLDEDADQTFLNVEVRVDPASGSRATTVSVSAGAATADGSMEKDAPVGSSAPAVVGLVVDGHDHPPTDLTLDGDAASTFTVRVRQVAGVATALDIQATPEIAR